MRKRCYISLCLALLAAGGCRNEKKLTEAQEERDPLVKAGQAYMEQQQWDKAVESFKQAIEEEPLMARPHLDLAIIYQQHKINYIHSIYHYDRYLELRPDSEKAKFINEQKLKVAQALANTLINNSPEVRRVVDDLKRLRQENAALKSRIAADPAPESVQQAVPTATRSSAQAASNKSDSSPRQVYHVVQGDTLSKIATKFYGDAGKYEAIYEANKDTMKNQNDLRIGQTLVIPSVGY